MPGLRPMDDEEFGPYLQVLKDAYVQDMVESGFLDPAAAESKADADIEAQLSEGPRTPDTFLYVVEDDAGASVGYAWMAKRPDQLGRPWRSCSTSGFVKTRAAGAWAARP